MSVFGSSTNESPPGGGLPSAYRKVDKRYRQMSYFAEDQLRYTESVQEFRSIKESLVKSSGFSVAERVFHFMNVPT